MKKANDEIENDNSKTQKNITDTAKKQSDKVVQTEKKNKEAVTQTAKKEGDKVVDNYKRIRKKLSTVPIRFLQKSKRKLPA